MSEVRPTPDLKPSNVDIAGMAIILSGTQKERCERLRAIIGEENIVAVEQPWKTLIRPAVRREERDGELVSEQVIDVFCPDGENTDTVIENAFKRIEGRDVDIWRQAGIPGAVDIKERYFCEVKSICEYLSRYHAKLYLRNKKEKDSDPDKINDPHPEARPINGDAGTVYFELYQAGGNRGALFDWYFPDASNEDGQIAIYNDKPKHVSPHYVVFLLFADAMSDEEEDLPMYPVAAISFKWDELKSRLNEMSGDRIENDTMPKRLSSEEKQKKTGLHRMGGDIIDAVQAGLCWHVSLDRLADIARVTIIGNPTRATLEAAKKRSTKTASGRKKVSDYWKIDRMEKRLEKLKEYANGNGIAYEYHERKRRDKLI